MAIRLPGEPEVTLVVPMWNEAARIGTTVERIAGSRLGADTELLLVDDGSTDDTREIARAAIASSGLPGAVLSSEVRGGKGAAVRHGVRAASGSIVAFADADLSAGPDEIHAVVSRVRSGEVDVVIASRRHPESTIVDAPPWRRRTAARAFNLLVRGLGLSDRLDTQCGLKAFTASAADQLFDELVSAGFAFDVEVLVRAERLGLRIEEAPVVWSHDRNTSVRMVRNGPATLRDLIRVRRRYGPRRAPRPL